jgi:adenylate kinase
MEYYEIIENYIDSHLHKEKVYEENMKDNLTKKDKIILEKNKINEFYEKLQKKEVFQHNKEKIEKLKAEERKELDKRSQDLRHYLSENVIPILSQGIMEICKKCPDDPVDELAKFLMEKSCQVAFNDPSKYKQS